MVVSWLNPLLSKTEKKKKKLTGRTRTNNNTRVCSVETTSGPLLDNWPEQLVQFSHFNCLHLVSKIVVFVGFSSLGGSQPSGSLAL